MTDLVVYDLEFTTWPGAQERNWSEPGEHREIVQIAAQAVELPSLMPTAPELNVLLCPRINAQLSPFCTELTGIRQETIDVHGLDFEQASENFRAYCGHAEICSYGCDHSIFNENIILYGLDKKLSFLKGRNIRPWFEEMTGDHKLPNSGALAEYLGLHTKPEHHAHYAMDDVHSILLSARYLIAKKGLQRFLDYIIDNN